MVTLKQIAAICGVSETTVKRVLNNSGSVKAETEAKVKMAVEKLGYNKKNDDKIILRQNLIIGVILISKGNPFFDEVIEGIRAASNEIREYGVDVVVRTMKGYNVTDQIKMIDSIKNECDLLVINPIDHPDIISKISEIADNGIQVITVNTDVKGSKRMCHIGNDYYKSGRTAGGMLGLISNGKGKVGIVTGSNKISGHNQRIEGFKEVISKKYSNIEIVDIIENEDDEILSYDNTSKMLENNPDIDMLYIVAGGVYGACCAVNKYYDYRKISIVCFDNTPIVSDLMEKGIIKAVICQQPFMQGYQAIKNGFIYLVSGEKPVNDIIYMDNDIRIAENI